MEREEEHAARDFGNSSRGRHARALTVAVLPAMVGKDGVGNEVSGKKNQGKKIFWKIKVGGISSRPFPPHSEVGICSIHMEDARGPFNIYTLCDDYSPLWKY